MKSAKFVVLAAALAAATSASAVTLPPIASGPAEPYRESRLLNCAGGDCAIQFTKVPEDKTLILSSVTCRLDGVASGPGLVAANVMQVPYLLAIIPRVSSDTAAITGVDLPIPGGQAVKILFSSPSGSGFCAIAGALYPPA